jgi:hypothetical protein
MVYLGLWITSSVDGKSVIRAASAPCWPSRAATAGHTVTCDRSQFGRQRGKWYAFHAKSAKVQMKTGRRPIPPADWRKRLFVDAGSVGQPSGLLGRRNDYLDGTSADRKAPLFRKARSRADLSRESRAWRFHEN